MKAEGSLVYHLYRISLEIRITNQGSVKRMWRQQKQSMTDGQTERRTTDKVIHMWRFPLLTPEKFAQN